MSSAGDIARILAFGNELIGAAQGASDVTEAPGSATNAAGALGMLAVLSGLANDSVEHPFAKSLLTSFGIQLSVLGVPLAIAQAIEAGAAYNQAELTGSQQDKINATKNLNDKVWGAVANIAAALALVPIPQVKLIAGGLWLGFSLYQQYSNGNFERVLDFLSEFATEAIGSMLDAFSPDESIPWEEDLTGTTRHDFGTYHVYVNDDGSIAEVDIVTVLEDGSTQYDTYDGEGNYIESWIEPKPPIPNPLPETPTANSVVTPVVELDVDATASLESVEMGGHPPAHPGYAIDRMVSSLVETGATFMAPYGGQLAPSELTLQTPQLAIAN